MNLDKKNLSKKKYIYRIYETDCNGGTLHIEKYPIIYANSKVVYFKDARKQKELNHKSITYIKNDFTEFTVGGYSPYLWSTFDEYFWNVEENIDQIYKDLKEQQILVRSKEQKEKQKLKLERAKKDYEAALSALNALEESENK